ncbi:PML-RARA-regulated adapter molecule 1 isoform X1 [Hippopotamus amphibius kiboko]|uniref:PML-RARA-regulated adapter molecule 1 isoform X1 n=1 Tax=Hippopotamus amphibius kiboko TaxID=575201 RepID=UPI002593036B|nr:PML-RARA-regulated adapter molecule 1 isoform X1 [Hippopotamus amphibius kiboko]
MGSHQDFRSLQAKFQASQPETSELPKKSPKPEFNKLLKRFPQPELGEHPKKPPQPEFTDLPKKPCKLESSELSKKLPQLEAPQKPPQPELSNTPRLPIEPKFSAFPRKFQQPEPNEATPKPLQPEFSALPKKPLQPEFCVLPRKPPQPQVSDLPKKSLLHPESSEVPPTPPSKPEFGESHLHSSQHNFSTLPKKPPQPEFCVLPRKPPQPQVSDLPKKSLLHPESSEVPPTPPSKPEFGEPHPHSSQHNFSTLPKKIPRPQRSDLPKKPPQPEFGDLTRTTSEPEVSVIPKRPRQCESKALSKKPLNPELGNLPRTSSEPEFSLLPQKFLQPGGQGPPRKFSQPDPSSLLKKHPQSEFLGDLPRKPPLPGSCSESSLPTAMGGSSPRFLLSPGFGARQQRSRACSGGSRPVLKSGHPPRRRPLPSVSSLGPPPAKPPLPPGPRDIQSFWRTSAASTASAGLHFQARQPKDIPPDPDEAYELYDDVEPTADSSPSPKGREAVLSTQQPLWRPPQDPEPRKEKAPQPQQLPPTDLKSLRQIRKAEKAEREFRKKFKFEGEIVIQTRMMIDPNAKTRRGGGKHLGIRRGEILEVIEFTNKEEMLCRDTKGKYGYVPRTALLPLETEVYDDVASWDPLDNQPFPGGR